MNNIFLATSPFQLMMAYEAKQSYKASNETLVLALDKKAPEHPIFLAVLKRQQWHNIIMVPDHSKLVHAPLLMHKLRRSVKQQAVRMFHAEPRSIFVQAIRGSFKIEHEIILDDGLASVVDHPNLADLNSNLPAKKKIKKIAFSLLGSPLAGKLTENKYTLFTIFHQELACLKAVKANTMAFLQASMSQTEESSKTEIAFIGQSFVGKHGMKLEPYISNVKQVLALKPQATLRYFPHRREDPECVKAIAALPRVILNQSQLPLEIEITEHPHIKQLFGFTSTAMFTLSKLYPHLALYSIPFYPEEFNTQGFYQRQLSAAEHYTFESFTRLMNQQT